MEHQGVKLGWLGGWFGSILFMPIVAAVLLSLHQTLSGIILLGTFFILLPLIFILVPWRFPTTRYWKLLLPLYVIFFLGCLGAVYTITGEEKPSPWLFWCLLPCLTPLFTIGGKTWKT